MISSNFSKLTLCAFLLANSLGQVSVAHAETSSKCATPLLKEHKGKAFVLAVLLAVGYKATPTEGTHELSEELFLNNTWTWFRNAFGWMPKDAKIKTVDEETGLPIYKVGYEGQGLVNAVYDSYKFVLPAATLMFAVKNIDPICQMIGLFQDEPIRKLV